MDLHKGDPNTQNPKSEYVFNNLNFMVLFIWIYILGIHGSLQFYFLGSPSKGCMDLNKRDPNKQNP